MRPFSSALEPSFAEESLQRLISEELQKLPQGVHVDLGPSLPSFYPVDRLILMVQDSFHVLAYWEITDKLKSQVLARFPEEDRNTFQLLLEWSQLESAHRRYFDPGTLAHWWFETNPGAQYQAVLCFYSEFYGLVPLLKSKPVETPRCSIEPLYALDDPDPATTEWLSHLLEQTSVARWAPPTRPVFAISGAGDHVSHTLGGEADGERKNLEPSNEGNRQESPTESENAGQFRRPTSW
jgi:hypothetical protein